MFGTPRIGKIYTRDRVPHLSSRDGILLALILTCALNNDAATTGTRRAAIARAAAATAGTSGQQVLDTKRARSV